MRHRLAIILPVYIAIITASLFTAYCLRFDFRINDEIRNHFLSLLPILIVSRLLATFVLGEWKRSYRHASVTDAVYTTGVCLLVSGLLLLGHYVIPPTTLLIPRSVILIDLVLCVLFMVGFRLVCRMIWSRGLRSERKVQTEPALIFGIDENAIGIWKMVMASNGRLGKYRIVGFVNPGPERQHSLIGGQPVYPLNDCWEQCSAKAQHILVPTTISGRVTRELFHRCQQADMKLHKIPTVDEIVQGRFRLAVRDLDIDDLLRRPPMKLDLSKISHTIRGKSVLVTGGAGSIGSELCRQILDFEPASLTIFDHSEFGIFQIEREFAQRTDCATQLRYVTASILDPDALETVFATEQPQLVFHAAAYKHVPLMQDNPYAAIRNNFFGTKAVVDAADAHGVERFVLVSTDKAVRPTSVMGATKLLAEKYLQAMSQKSETAFLTVRFGNVLNSVGSVVPTFRKQIEAGGPVTVTHEDMVRYFMTIPEAVQLVLQAGAIGDSGNVMILDMGEPVRIVDLAKDMIALSGLSYPDDIDIEFTGLRPGEKMYEELFYAHEQGAPRIHEKIFLGSGYAPTPAQIQTDLQSLQSTLRSSSDRISNTLWNIVNRYVALDDPLTEQSTRKAA